jgi:Flp pilus assembly pilin Flp
MRRIRTPDPGPLPGRAGLAARLRLAIGSRSDIGSRSAGQGVVEYGLILSLSAALAAVLLVFFGGTLSAVLNAVGDAIDAAS